MKRLNLICTIIFGLSLSAFLTFAVYRKITIDNTVPVIQMDSETIEISVKDDESALMQGMTAYDDKDGDVTSSIVIEDITEFIDENTRQIDYVAFDRDDHVAKTSRRLVYTDYEAPRFELESPLKFPMSNYDFDILGGVHVTDCIEGDISERINFSDDSMVNLSIASDYKVTLVVTNDAGDTQELPVTVVIYDSTQERMCPQIQLSEYLVYTKVGEKLNLKSYISGMTYGGVAYEIVDEKGLFGEDVNELYSAGVDLTTYNQTGVNRKKFRVSDSIDYDVPGVYEVTFTLDDSRGYRGSTNMIVIVEDR